jgi:hypothetical protein
MNTLLVYEWPIDKTPSVVGANSAVEWSAAGSPLISRLFAAEPDRVRAQSEMLAQGYVGLLHAVDDQWAAYAWMKRPQSLGPSFLPAKMRRLPCYWITYCRTREALQGRGIFRDAIVRLVGIALAEDPAARVIIDTGRRNQPSQRAIAAAGFAPAGTIQTVSLGIPRLGSVVWGSWRDR